MQIDLEKWARPTVGDIVSTCGCGQQHNLYGWLQLKTVGEMICPPEVWEPDTLELRDCPCGSTIGVWLDDQHKHVVEINQTKG